MSDRPLPSSFDGNEEFYNEKALSKVFRRLKEEPLVPIGCLLTVAAFTNAWRATRRGDHAQVQRMFRARVAAQAFTVIAMVAGGMYYAEDRRKTQQLGKIKAAQEAEEKRVKWIKELEARDEEDKAVRERLGKMRKRAEERKGVTAQVKEHMEKSKAESDPSDEEKDSQGETPQSSTALGSIGGWFGGSSKTSSPSSAKGQTDVELRDQKVDPESPKK